MDTAEGSESSHAIVRYDEEHEDADEEDDSDSAMAGGPAVCG